jgi:hypothetical protein
LLCQQLAHDPSRLDTRELGIEALELKRQPLMVEAE